MATVVSIMDRAEADANTDVIVVADPKRRSLLWIPRDLWSPLIENRVNRAFALGGHEGLRSALAGHGIDAEHGICLGRPAVAAALEGISVRVPVEARLEFWYPLAPEAPIEAGRKLVRFEPPEEELAGERIHQWIGARYRVEGPGSDLDRIRRQQTLLAALLRSGFDFGRVLDPALPVLISAAEAIAEISQVREDWCFETLAGLVPRLIDGKDVLTVPPTGASA
jgi:anionic cell wall polymer biosynthesis LytR-Cps2A-Psr (LCP) family protein